MSITMEVFDLNIFLDAPRVVEISVVQHRPNLQPTAIASDIPFHRSGDHHNFEIKFYFLVPFHQECSAF